MAENPSATNQVQNANKVTRTRRVGAVGFDGRRLRPSLRRRNDGAARPAAPPPSVRATAGRSDLPASVTGLGKGVLKKQSLRAAWIPIRVVAFILTPIQFVAGIITMISIGLWIYAEDWTWGVSNYVLPNDIATTVFWGISSIAGLLILATAVFSFYAIARVPILNDSVTGLFLIFLFVVIICPVTTWIPGGLIFCLVVYLRHR